MKTIDAHVLRRLHSEIAQGLRHWEESPDDAHVSNLRSTASQVREQLAAWDAEGVYPSGDLRRLGDAVAHVDARLVLARQEATRGY
jgi:hypothetical protein